MGRCSARAQIGVQKRIYLSADVRVDDGIAVIEARYDDVADG